MVKMERERGGHLVRSSGG
jgi:hypothetical protein